jgi:hypothetical protein
LKKQEKQSSVEVAEKNYEPSDYQDASPLSTGLAVTHEQVSDTLTEGTIDGKIDDLDGKDAQIPRKGYQDE